MPNAAHAVLTSAAEHSWRHMMDAYNATATMECWLPEELPNLSFSHVWSSSPAIVGSVRGSVVGQEKKIKIFVKSEKTKKMQKTLNKSIQIDKNVDF